MTTPRPTPAIDRIDDLDALRGFALLGILLVNIAFFASAYHGSGLTDPAFDGWWDRFVPGLVRTLCETKFYLLFSFLFGYSFSLQMESARRAESAFVPRYLRRSAGLALLGIGHALLLFHGDILLTYALLGLLLLGLRDLAPKTAVYLAIVLLVATALSWALVGLAIGETEPMVPTPEIHAAVERVTAAYRSSIGATIAQHALEMRSTMWLLLGFIQAPCALAMFLLGLAAAKGHYFTRLAGQRKQLWRMLALGTPIGLAGAWCYNTLNTPPVQPGSSLLGLAISIVTAPALTGAYMAALLLFLHHPKGKGAALCAWLAPAGRMALTNYLLQSVVCAFVFTAWGWALMGALAPPQVFLFALLIYLAQLWHSRWWMRSHSYGPVEWLLRALTHGRRPPWRRMAGQL